MRRREFIAGTALSTATWPFASHAQKHPPNPVIGVVRISARGESPHFEDAFRQGLAQVGYVENQNVTIEWRWADGHYERLPDILNELVARRVDVMAVPGATAAALAAKTVTKTIPTVFMLGVDPVEFGLVASLAHPGGNMTGVAQLMTPATAKRLDLLRQLVPTSKTFGLLTHPANPFGQAERSVLDETARALGVELHVTDVEREDDIDASIAKLITLGAHAIIIGGDSFYLYRVGLVARLAARYGIPSIAQWREYPAAGGLMSYGNDISEAFRLTGVYVGRILDGEKPTDMPVQQPTRFNLAINLKTAKTLDFMIPDRLLATADEVIE